MPRLLTLPLTSQGPLEQVELDVAIIPAPLYVVVDVFLELVELQFLVLGLRVEHLSLLKEVTAKFLSGDARLIQDRRNNQHAE